MKNSKAIQTQDGSALIICLVLLMVLSLIGISSVENSILEEKMAINTQIGALSFQTTKGMGEEQIAYLRDNPNLMGDAVEGDRNLDINSGGGYSGGISALSHIDIFERRARRKEDIQSMGTSKVLVNELTVSSSLSSAGVVSEQTFGLELSVPSS